MENLKIKRVLDIKAGAVKYSWFKQCICLRDFRLNQFRYRGKYLRSNKPKVWLMPFTYYSVKDDDTYTKEDMEQRIQVILNRFFPETNKNNVVTQLSIQRTRFQRGLISSLMLRAYYKLTL